MSVGGEVMKQSKGKMSPRMVFQLWLPVCSYNADKTFVFSPGLRATKQPRVVLCRKKPHHVLESGSRHSFPLGRVDTPAVGPACPLDFFDFFFYQSGDANPAIGLHS